MKTGDVRRETVHGSAGEPCTHCGERNMIESAQMDGSTQAEWTQCEPAWWIEASGKREPAWYWLCEACLDKHAASTGAAGYVPVTLHMPLSAIPPDRVEL